MHRETVAPIYIRIFGPQTVKTAHGIDDRKAQPRRTLLFGPLIKAFEDMVRIERTARTAVADAQTIPGNGHRHFAARISVDIGVPKLAPSDEFMRAASRPSSRRERRMPRPA